MDPGAHAGFHAREPGAHRTRRPSAIHLILFCDIGGCLFSAECAHLQLLPGNAGIHQALPYLLQEGVVATLITTLIAALHSPLHHQSPGLCKQVGEHRFQPIIAFGQMAAHVDTNLVRQHCSGVFFPQEVSHQERLARYRVVEALDVASPIQAETRPPRSTVAHAHPHIRSHGRPRPHDNLRCLVTILYYRDCTTAFQRRIGIAIGGMQRGADLLDIGEGIRGVLVRHGCEYRCGCVADVARMMSVCLLACCKPS